MFRLRLTHAIAALCLSLLACLPAHAQAPTFPSAGVVTTNANLRAGPGTTYARVGGVKAGDAVQVLSCNTGCTWYKLDGGQWIAASLVELGGASAPAAQAGPPAGAVAAQVTGITDGDTITVRMGGQDYKLRYILINTPEVDQPLAAEATAANRALVMGKTVYLLKDVSETDRYGRLLRYVYLADGTFVNAELVRDGWAQVATFPPDVTKETEIRAAQAEAMAAGRGLWADGGAAAADNEGQRTTTVPIPAAATATPAPAPTVQPAPAASDGGKLVIVAVDKRDEYVDIRNNGAAAVDLSGWVLRSEKGSQDCALGGSIAPGATLRIWAMTGEGRFNCGFDGNVWNNSEPDPAVLLSPDGGEVSRY